MHDRPTAAELLIAVREFLQLEIVPTLSDHRQKFRTLIAMNVLSVVERQLAGEEEYLREEWQGLVALDPAHWNTPRPETMAALRAGVEARLRELCDRIRTGEADTEPWRAAVHAYARWSVEQKLRVSNPRYLKQSVE